MKILKKYNERWKKHIIHHRLRELVFCSRNVYLFLDGLQFKETLTQEEIHDIDIGKFQLKRKLKHYLIVMEYDEKEYYFYKTVHLKTYMNKEEWEWEPIGKKEEFSEETWEWKTLGFLEESKKEDKEAIHKIINTFPFENFIEEMQKESYFPPENKNNQ